jgi:glutamate synthase (NADPH/NADH) large chain/glutamate synthase (ferredoxin)
MGAIAQLQGKRSYQVLDYALTSVCCMTHRGAVDADMKSGDGSGVLTQIPYPLFLKASEKLGYSFENELDMAVAVFFFPSGNPGQAESLKELSAEITGKRGIRQIGWREVPVDLDALGKKALATRPQIEHLIMARPEGMDSDTFERQLYLCRREIEARTKEIHGFYMPSFSSRDRKSVV